MTLKAKKLKPKSAASAYQRGGERPRKPMLGEEMSVLVVNDTIFVFEGRDWFEQWSSSEGRQYLFRGVCATVSYHSSINIARKEF